MRTDILPKIACIFFVLGCVLGQVPEELSPEIQESLSDIENQFPELGNIDKSQIPNAEEVENALSEKCDRVSGTGTFAKVKDEQVTFQECISNIVNVTQLKLEVEESKKTGSMDEVFGKYCDKYPDMQECTEPFLNVTKMCLEDKEKDSLNLTMHILNNLQEFACFKNGDRIAMFVAEGGVDCIQSQSEGLQDCAKTVFGKDIPENVTLNSIPLLVFDPDQCMNFDKMRICVNEVLEKCKDTTPANIVDAFFKYLKKMLPCHEFVELGKAFNKTENGPGGSASTYFLSSLILLVAGSLHTYLF